MLRARPITHGARRPLPALIGAAFTTIVTTILIAAGLAVLPAAPAAAATESVTVIKRAPDQVMVGEPAEISLTAHNAGDTPEYNLTFRDVLADGVTYQPGSTRPTALGEPQVRVRGDGRQVLIWDNVSDLPVGAEQEVRFQVVPDVTALPVRASFTNVGDVYVNADPRTIPKFDSQGEYTAGATAQASSNTTTTDITAIEVEKLEPSPEHELVRGVHQHPTTYTLRVTNNQHHADNDVVLVDYLPAQLEFLGCGDVDNSAGVEYPTAPRLDVSTPDVAGCITPFSVSTVDSTTDPDAPAGGVHTRVEWHLADLAAGETRDVVYAAGIPQRANELSFGGGGAPTPESIGQAANLDNNTGLSTRETDSEQALTNRVSVAADYQGPVAAGGPAVSDTDELTVTSEDLAVQKSVSPGTFDQGGIATYTLHLQTSEYADSTDVVVTDTIPNGLCPLGGAGTNYAGSAPAECEGSGATAPTQSFDSVTENADGTFTVVFTPFDLAHDGTRTITYQARMLENYRGPDTDPTVVGDDYTNVVELTGTTTTLDAVQPPGGVGTQTVHDGSEATIHSDTVVLDKRIQPNTSTPYTCSATAADYQDSAGLPPAQTTFGEGSRVCFLLRIDFPAGNETKNAVLTDFLPDYLEYEAGSAVPMPGNEVTTDFDETDLTFTLGETQGSNRFVPRGQTFLYRLSGIVARSAGGSTPDIPGNLAKLRWTNTDGVVGFLRDREDFRVPPPPRATLVKSADRSSATAPGSTGPLAENATVRDGDVVEFTVTIGNAEPADGTPQRTIIGPDTWDRLPAGIECADVSSISDAGVCLDPGDFDPTDPADPSYAGDDVRSVIRWDLPDSIRLEPGDTRAFTYRVTYPASIAATRTYRNDADIASYATETNLGTLVTHHPAQNVDDRVPAEDQDAPRAHDDHTLLSPQAAVTKANTTDVADTGQGPTAGTHYAAVGEHVAYVVDSTLPADATIYAGVLTDQPPTGIRIDAVTYEYRAAPGDPFGALPAGWTTSTPPAPARVTLPATHATGSTEDTIRMTISATVVDNPANGHNQVRTNTARFTSEDELGNAVPVRQAQSSVTTVAPRPAPLKTVDDDTPVAGQTITFTVTARNANPADLAQQRPTLHDAEVVDCVPTGLAPAGPATATGTATIETVGTHGCSAGQTPVVWQVGDLDWRSPVDAAGADPWPTLTYTAVVDPAAAGAATYTNVAALSGYSLDAGHPDRVKYTQSATETVVVPAAGLAKSVTPTKATIGEQVSYTIRTTLPQDVNFYDATIIDQLPAGVDPASVTFVDATCEYDAAGGGTCAPVATAADALSVDGQLHGWFLGDVASDAQPRVLTLRYTAVIDDVAANAAGTALVNTARLRWNLTDTVTSGKPDPTDSFDGGTAPGTATVTVIEPAVTIAKSVDETTPLPGETFTYTVVVTNGTGATVSTAHDVDVEDAVPAGVRVLSGTISNGGALTGATPGGGTITWSDLGPIAPGDKVTLTYDAQLVSPAPTTPQTNTADVTDYTSLPGGGRHYDGPSDTAEVTAGLPDIEIDKTVLDTPPAYVGEPVRWQIKVTNTGPATAHDVDVTDTLPAEWTYETGTQLSVAGAPAVAREPDGVTGDPSVLTWDNLGDLAEGESLTLVLTATPGPGVVPTLVGGAVPHVNDAVATAQDLDGSSGSVVTTDDDDAQTRIDSADLVLDKQAVGTPVAGAPFSWTLRVSNGGPDAAAGPFTVTDTLPAGVSRVTASGTGWTCAPPAPADPVVISCERTGTLAAGSAFPLITVTATVDVDAADGSDLVNGATVSGHTYDPDPDNNDDETTSTVKVESDMGIEKTLDGDLVPGAGATYRIAVRNAGPSPAYGAVTVTDTLPAGTTFESYDGAGWDLTRSGQDLTFTWTGATPVPVGAMPDITVRVKVDSDLAASVTNSAHVSEPTDPTSGPEEPDTDSVTTPPSPKADLGIAKSSVGEFKAGKQGVYEFTVTNFGPSAAAGPVKVTDQLPAELSYDSVASSDGWSCSATGQDLTCTRAGGLALGASSTFRVTVDVAETLSGNVQNTAAVDGPTPDPNPGNDTDTDDTGVDVESDLSIVKSLVTDPVVAGADVTYRLAVHNDGPATSPGPITVTDALPAGLTFVSAAGTGWTCSAAAGVVTCDRAASLASGADAPVITVVAHVDSGVGTTTLTNVASVDGPATDPTPADNTDDVDTPVSEDAEISVTKSVSGPTTITAGTNATFEVVVSNAGPSDARDVTVTDLLPAGMSLVSASGAGWTCTAGVCTRDRVVTGTSAPAITVVARVSSSAPGGSSLTNTVTVSTSTPGDTPAGNTDDATVGVVTSADLALVKSHSGSAVAGTSTTFTIEVRNHGPSDSAGPTTVVDHLPAGLSYVSANAPWTCALDAGNSSVVRCTIPQGIGAGGTLPVLSLQVMVSSAAAGTLTNSATVSSPTPDPDPANDTDTAQVGVTHLADLSIVKSHTGTARIGDTLTYTLLVRNDGPSPGRDVVITDTLPAGLDYVSASGAGWSCSRTSGVVSCALAGPLAPGATAAPVSVVVGVTPQAYPGVTNVATVTSSTTDPDPSDNQDSDTVELPALVDLQVHKTHIGKLVVGQQGTYEIEVTNDGPTAAPGPITVTDALPDGLALVAVTGSGWACADASGTVTCVLESGLAAGASSTIRVVVDVLPAAYPAVANTATVTSPDDETDPPGDDDNTSTDDGAVEAVSKLEIDKEVVRSDARTVVYRITVTNLGPSQTITPITVRDPMPEGLELARVEGKGWSCTTSPKRAECVHGDSLAAGAESELMLTAKITAKPGAQIVNVATASGVGGGVVSDDALLQLPIPGVIDPEGPDGGPDGDGGTGPGGLLPDTGGPALVLLPIGLLLLGAGTLLLVRRRRS